MGELEMMNGIHVKRCSTVGREVTRCRDWSRVHALTNWFPFESRFVARGWRDLLCMEYIQSKLIVIAL